MTRLQIVVSLIGTQNNWSTQHLTEKELEKLFALAERLIEIDAKRPQK